MHSLLFYIFDKVEDETSERAYNRMCYIIKDDICGKEEDSDGIGDWCVIGGRWSGELSRLYLDPVLLEKCNRELYGPDGLTSSNNVDSNHRRIQDKYFPKLEVPILSRDTYQDNIYGDDVMLIDEVIFRKILEYKGNCEHLMNASSRRLSKKMIGTCWVAVVDYHN